MSQDRFNRLAVVEKIRSAISGNAPRRSPSPHRRPVVEVRDSRPGPRVPVAHLTAANFDAGSRQRWATRAKQIRSTSVAVDAPALGRRSQRGSDTQPLPHLVEHERTTEPTGIDDLDVGRGDRGAGRRQIEDPADGRDQPRQGDLVDLVLASEVVDDLGHRNPGLRVALVVGQLEIGDLGAVLVPATGLSQVHTYIVTEPRWSVN